MDKRNTGGRHTNELQIIREALEAIRESGRKLSAASRARVDALKARLSALDYHPGVQDALALADELLALDVEPEVVAEAELREYNPNHGGDGRFTGKGGAGGFSGHSGNVDSHLASRVKAGADEGILKVGTSKRKAALTAEVLDLDSEVDARMEELAAEFKGDARQHKTRIDADPLIKRLRSKRKELSDALDDNDRFTESVNIIEAVQGSKGRQWDVVLITAGKSLNNRTYPAALLRKSAPLFEGSFAFADHPEPSQAGRDRSIRDKVGRFSGVRFDTWTQGGKVTEGLRARFTVMAPWLRELLVEAVDAGDPEFVGFSINARGRVAKGIVESIDAVDSVDVVSTPAAGGRVERLVASVERSSSMDETAADVAAIVKSQVDVAVATITEALAPKVDEVAEIRKELAKATAKASLSEALAEAKVTDISKGTLRKRYTALIEAGLPFDAEDLQAAITESAEYEAALAAQFAKPPVFSTTRVAAGDSASDVRQKRMSMSLDHRNGGWAVDGVKPYTSIKESYCDFTGQNPFEVSPLEIFNALVGARYDSAFSHKRIAESLTTASWTDVFVDATYNQLIANYNLASFHNDWRALAGPNIKNVPNFRTQNFTLVGGYGDLSSVAEQETYPTLTSPGDDDMEFAVAKYGGLDDITMETIVNDLIGAIATIPRKMGEAAARTLYKFVFNLVTTDNAAVDITGDTLYHANHSNTGTTALTLAGLAAVRAAMLEKTRYGTTAEILGVDNAPKLIIVPAELEMLAKRIINPSGTYSMSPTADTDGSVDPQAFAGMGMQVLVYPYLTDANNWYAVADPNKVDGLVLGFLGSQEPELFTQDSPTTGSVFTSDKVSFKVRHIYGGDIADYRPFYRQVVT